MSFIVVIVFFVVAVAVRVNLSVEAVVKQGSVDVVIVVLCNILNRLFLSLSFSQSFC